MHTVTQLDAEGQASAKRHAGIRRRSDHRFFLWRQSSLPRVRACGRNRIDVAEPVKLLDNGGATNLQSCGSIWACPVCAPKVREGRAEEWRIAKAVHRALGGHVAMLSLTTRHHKGQSLRQVFDFIAAGFRQGVISGRRWTDDKATYGIVGTIRALEVTWSAENGWHPHVHVLVLFDAEPSPTDLAHLEERIWDRWSGFMRSAGSPLPNRAYGIDLVLIPEADDRSDDYPFKWDDAAEVMRGDLKTARRKGLAPWELLSLAADWGDAEALDLWREYEAVTKGRQCITWSKGLKARFAIEETTDQDKAEEATGGEVVYEVGELDRKNLNRCRGAWGEVKVLALLGPTAEAAIVRFLRSIAERPDWNDQRA